MPVDIDMRDTAPLREYRHQFLGLGTIAGMVNQRMCTDYRGLMRLYEREYPKFQHAEDGASHKVYGVKGFAASLYPGEKYDHLMDEVTKKGPAAIPPTVHALLITARGLRAKRQAGKKDPRLRKETRILLGNGTVMGLWA